MAIRYERALVSAMIASPGRSHLYQQLEPVRMKRVVAKAMEWSKIDRLTDTSTGSGGYNVLTLADMPPHLTKLKETGNKMKRFTFSRLSSLIVMAVLAFALAPAINFAPALGAQAQAESQIDTQNQNEISAELIGQVYNPSAQISAQYGYVSSLKGLANSAITGPSGVLSESTALLTFYNHTITQRVINNGPMRVIDRTGEATFYLTTTPHGDFTHPDTLRDGTPVMTAALSLEANIDTLTGAFAVHFDCTIARNQPFTIAGTTYRLGVPGQHFQYTLYGHLNQQGLPSAYITGFATGLELEATR